MNDESAPDAQLPDGGSAPDGAEGPGGADAESDEPARVGQGPSGFRHGMRAFRHRDFRLFFAGALASNSGNWLQNLAVPFVLFELTQRSIWVGLAGFALFFPAFVLGPIGGSMADRLDRRLLLLGTQVAMATSAFLMWGTWVAGIRNATLVLALTALTGVFSGLMIPSWQAFVPALVPREDLASAITLNSIQFNASRAIGPALAGLVLAFGGPSWVFFLNGLSFVAVIGVLLAIRASGGNPAAGQAEGVVAGFRTALGYIRHRTGILVSIASAVLVAFFGNPVVQFAVVLADEVYDAGPRVIGVLTAAVGIGAVLIAPLLSSWDARLRRSTVVRWALPTYGLSVVGFGLAPTWPVALVALLAIGAGFLAVIATTNTSVQLIVADHMRGRVMSARIMAFTFSFPIGSLLQGAAADIWGPQATIVTAGACLTVGACYLAARPVLLATLDNEDDAPDR